MPGAIVRGPTHVEGRPCLYVTVDDGPDAEGSPRWLDVLARHDARAVFFLSAGRAKDHPDLVRQFAEAGHRVGSHGDDHVSGWRSPRAVRASFERAERVLESLVRAPVRDVRPPYGRVTPGLVRWAREGRRRIVLWDLMPGDFLPSRSPSALADEIVRLVRPGSILALHDGPPARRAVAALDLALPRLAAAGWTVPLLPAP
ncbi:polysaccharide deacetylase family protein [Rubrivirga marina]|uniref:polysaccharide deacetylase family protein n=1 Tax=Rubrivirga marina TaxID=1196024 RepID=UPI0015CD9128|nr:polysaccharide deacetylase family protein [Rubrivirga marina]